MLNNIAYIVTVLSMIGTMANSHKKRWCFYIWLCTNAFWCIYNFIQGQYAQGLLYVFNFAMAILGLIKWKPQERSISNERYDLINNERRKYRQKCEEHKKENQEWIIKYTQNDIKWQQHFKKEVSNWESRIRDLQLELEFERSRKKNG